MEGSIDKFVEVAYEYCSFVENPTKFQVSEFFMRARELLPLLYYHAQMLPDVGGIDEYCERDITHEQWNEIYSSLKSCIGKHDLFWVVFDPIKNEGDEPTAASLSDALADVWRDLKCGFIYWEKGSNLMKEEAVFKWKMDFHIHWSGHVVDSLRAINSLIENNDLVE